MATASGDDIPTQLAALLGKDGALVIRKTDEVPPRASVVDLISGMLGLNGNNAAYTFTRLRKDYPKITDTCGTYQFKGRGQRKTPVADVRACVEILLLLPGSQAARIRRRAAELLVRFSRVSSKLYASCTPSRITFGTRKAQVPRR